MYETFYKLREKPFAILPDPAYLYFGDRHTLAYTVLEYGVVHGAGFTVITGAVGCGKTTLIRHLLDSIEQDVTVGLISNTRQDIGELLKWVLLAFDQPYAANDTVALFDQLQRFLINEYAQGRRTVLIIDEAQNLGVNTLEELRMLSNINADKDQLLQMVLVGQPQLKHLLSRPELEQFAQRVSADFHIEPLAADEVGPYIRHRLHVAGRDEPLFEEAAIERIVEATGGTPRKINILCDTALVYGFSQEAEAIGPRIIEEVLRDKARFGVMGTQGDNSGMPGQGPAAWPADVGDTRTRRSRDDAAARAVLAAMFDRKK
jgi:general secretion pathway protein A